MVGTADRGADGMLTIEATPLLRAAKAFDAASIRLLLEAGARTDVPNSRGMIPFTAAAGLGSRVGDTRGWFETADVEQRSIASLTLLLLAGTDVNSTDSGTGQTALHGATAWGWNDVVGFLLDQGAQPNSPDNRGLTPLDAAMGRTGRRGPGEIRSDTAALLEGLGGVSGVSGLESPDLGPPGR